MKKFNPILLTFMLSAATVATTSLADDSLDYRKTVPLVDESARKGTERLGTPEPDPRNTVMYSNTTAGGSSWTRALADCSGLTGLGPMTYHFQNFQVDADGAYDLTSVQAGWDGFLLLYRNSFDPGNPLANCVTGNDDGGGGIGTSEILQINLTSGVLYTLVTTGFEAGEEGSFENTLSGPGTILFLPPQSGNVDLSIIKTGSVPSSGTFIYEISVCNDGPNAATSMRVTDRLPAGIVYESDNCGGYVENVTDSLEEWTWIIGVFSPSGCLTCRLTVRKTDSSCTPVTNTASVWSILNNELNEEDNTSTASNATPWVNDGSFEDGSPNAVWDESSINFATPLCSTSGCGTGPGTGPHSGFWWAWFGGIAALETASLTQSVTIPEGSILSFYFEAPLCANTTDFVRVQIDGTTVWEATGAHPRCNSVGYELQTVDISAFDDGASHTLNLTSTISGIPSGSSFFIDDVAILTATCVVEGAGAFETSFDVGIPTLSNIGFSAMTALLTLGALVMLRRR